MSARSTVFYWIIVAALHVGGLALLLTAAHAHAALVGIGFLAYTLGLRHAFDADHIAAIDNVVRKLAQQRRDPLGVGFYFSLGHSTVVCVLAVGAALAARWATALPVMRDIGSTYGTLISGGFLLLIGIVNLVIWFETLALFERVRRGASSGDSLEQVLGARGFLARLAAPLFRLVESSRHAYPIGLLFGLGFDTASEVALLALSATAAATAMPVIGVLALPVLFAAGMTLMDTADGVLMTRAYGWAFSAPLRKLWYNLTVTGLSVVAALGIGSLELASVAGRSAGASGAFWSWLQQIDLSAIGLGLVALFIVTWLLSYGAWRLYGFEER